jgi:hypothetical protein
MPYFVIGGEPVFMTNARLGKLRAQLFPSVTDRISSLIEGHPEAEIFGKRCHEIVAELHQANPNTFRREWVFFDLVDEEARGEIAYLLYDSCHFHRRGHVRDARDVMSKIVAGYMGDDITAPLGRIFFLECESRRRHWRDIFRQTPVMRVIIAVDLVKRITGCLKSFSVVFDRHEIRVGENIEILPFVSGHSPQAGA